jgi:N-acetylmuramoyl-L-alanine amidase
MRAHEFLDEDWKKWGVPAIYAGINAAALAGRMAGYGGEPAALQQPAQQQQDGDTQDYVTNASVTVGLPDAQPFERDSEGKLHVNNKAASLLALTIWGEARQDGPKGMRAVGHVIINRMKSKRAFGNDVAHVVWHRKAFSCWNEGDPNREAMEKIKQLPKGSPDYQRWMEAKKIATQLLAGELRDITHGSLFYYADSMDNPPAWAHGVPAVAHIGNHTFLKNDHKKPSATA